MNLVDVVKELGDKSYSIGRPVYFSMDDEEQQSVQIHALPVLKMGMPGLIEKIRREKENNTPGIAVAYGGFIGIDLAVAHNAEGILLLDVNPEQKHFWRSVIALIEECPTAASFKERFSVLGRRYEFRKPTGDVKEAYPSFIEDENLYAKVRGWAQNGMMASTDMDVLDTQRHHELAGLLTKAEKNVGMLFLTNVPYFYNLDGAEGKSASKRSFYSDSVGVGDYELIFENQKIIAGDDTKVIYADSCTSAQEFPLSENMLGALLPSVALR